MLNDVYGGTKEEMERLLADAEKLSGQKYDIGNFADIIKGINVIQDELGITGTTAKEAATTISGSFNSLKSAWSNVLRAVADDGADFNYFIDNLVDSAVTFGENIFPRIKVALEGIGILFEELAKRLPEILLNVAPLIVDSGIKIIDSLLKSIISSLPKILEAGGEITNKIIEGIKQSLPNIIQGALLMVTTLLNQIITMLPQLLQMGIDIIVELALGIAETLPELIPLAIDAILLLVETLLDNIDNIIDAGIKLIIGLADGLIIALPKLIDKIPIIIEKLLMAITNNLPKLIEVGIKLIFSLQSGLIKAIPNLIRAVPQIISSLVSSFGNYYSNLAKVGFNLVAGIWDGIKGAGGWLMSKISGFADGIVSGIQGFFKIFSPSRVMRDEVGVYLAQGIGVGFEDEMEDVNADIQNSLTTDFDIPTANKPQDKTDIMIALLQQLVNKDNSLNVDGRELARSLSPYQEENDIYNSRSPRFA